MSVRKVALQQIKVDSPYDTGFDLKDSDFQDRTVRFKVEPQHQHSSQISFVRIAPSTRIRSPLPPLTEPRGIHVRSPMPMDSATATQLLQRASNVSLELNASKAVVVITSTMTVFAFLFGGPLYGVLASLPAIIAALSFRVLRGLSKTAKKELRQ